MTRRYQIEKRKAPVIPKTRTASIYLDRADFDYLDGLARVKRISRSRAIAQLIDRHRRAAERDRGRKR